MTEKNGYTPPRVWTLEKENGGKFSSTNRPVAGATHSKALPIGEHPLQLYSLGTPNGIKVTILLEELLLLGKTDAEYDAWLIDILKGEQFGSGFTEINPNSKIPALLDTSTNPSTPIFESGAILLYLAEKYNAFLPKTTSEKAKCYSWLFWQVGSAPFLGGGFGHFYAYAPEKFEYPINRYAMEVKRQLDVLDKHLASHQYLCGDDYNISDIANYAWYGLLVQGKLYEAEEFLDVKSYKNVLRWSLDIKNRPAVRRGQKVNRTSGDKKNQVRERHKATDLD